MKSKLWNKIGGYVIAVMIALVVWAVIVGAVLAPVYRKELATCQSQLAGVPSEPTKWMVGYVKWDKATTGALRSHPWLGSAPSEGQKGEGIFEATMEFAKNLDNPSEPTYILNLALVEVKEDTPLGPTWWALLFAYTEDGWALVDSVTAE